MALINTAEKRGCQTKEQALFPGHTVTYSTQDKVCMYLDDHTHNGQCEDPSRVGHRPAIDVITSCQSHTQAIIRIYFVILYKPFTNATGREKVNKPSVH